MGSGWIATTSIGKMKRGSLLFRVFIYLPHRRAGSSLSLWLKKFGWHTSVWIGMGAFVLAASVQIGSSTWPDKIRPHPYVFIAFIGVGLLCVTIPAIRAVWTFISNRINPSIDKSPLEIIFEPLNPARRFWSLVSHVDDYKRLIGNFWEHRVEVKNNSLVTLRNVVVTVEKIGPMPVMAQRATFVRTGLNYCDINPGCSELVLVNRHPHPKIQEGSLAGRSAWGYGPIKIVVSADNTLPAETIYDFNYETDQMLFERGKY